MFTKGLVFTFLCIVGVSQALYSPQSPRTVAWDRGLGLGYAYNTDTSLYPFARIVTGNQPDQISVTLQSPTSVVINWVVGNGQLYNSSSNVTQPNTAGVQSIVKYAPKNGSQEMTANGFSEVYKQLYVPAAGMAENNYTSGIINHVALTGLMPDTEYYYKVGDGKNWSLPYEFVTLQSSSMNFMPYRIGVVADLGITDNSTTTLEHLTESLPDLVTLIGDWCYADNLLTNGTITPSTYNGSDRTYQPTWDQFGRWWSTLTSRVPFIAAPGNHEYEDQSDNTTYASYNARFNMTSDLSASGTSKYYSVNLPGVHIITLSPYDDYNTSSKQYAWLMKDLASYDRSRTPFLVVQFHAPLYNTYVSHYKEVECARLVWEPLFYQYGVDLVMAGHVHAYERTNRVYNYAVNPCGPTYITIGDAGNIEQLSVPSADQPGNCPAIKLTSSPGSKFQGNCQWYNFQAENANTTNNGFCPTQQPSWSAYREPSFGHGTLDVYPTKMVWAWHRNQDAEPITADVFEILPKDATCLNAKGPAPSLAPSTMPAAVSG